MLAKIKTKGFFEILYFIRTQFQHPTSLGHLEFVLRALLDYFWNLKSARRLFKIPATKRLDIFRKKI